MRFFGESPRMDAANLVGGLLIALALYLLPGYIASHRNHHNANAIYALNILLGWTFLGWVIALIWSLTATREE